MKPDFTPNCRATGIGSLPHTEAKEACELVLRTLPQIPFWPQLPKRTFRENMYWQYSEGLPGLSFEDERMFIRTPEDFSTIERFYERFLSEDLDFFTISHPYAAGFYKLQEYQDQLRSAWALKGQITGPISFTLQVTDENRRPLLYHDELKSIAIKNLLRKANWQEKILQKFNPRTIIFLDEPYLTAFGSAFTSLSLEQAIESLEEVLQGIRSLTGIHCCGNTDWSLILGTSIDILSFDAYEYAPNLLLYGSQLKKYLDRGGNIAWGIVPTNEDALKAASANDLLEKLEKIWQDLVNKGIDQEQIIRTALITPACGLGTVHKEMAEKALTLTGDISRMLREKYRLE
ncbi:MAG: methionine synthase [bacterium]|nr:methionine synthase [bacterium]